MSGLKSAKVQIVSTAVQIHIEKLKKGYIVRADGKKSRIWEHPKRMENLSSQYIKT